MTADPGDSPRYLGGAAIARRRGVSHDLFAHRMRRHPAGLPRPDAWQELTNGRLVPLWRPGREPEFEAWEATFPGRTGRPRKAPQEAR